MTEIDPKTILHKIGNFKVVNPCVRPIILTPEEQFKNLMIKGLERQLEYIQNDINEVYSTAPIRRWYKSTEDKKGFYCFLKYQNKPIPYLENDSTAILADTLDDVKTIFTNLKKEIEENPEFSKYLFQQSKKIKLAKGATKQAKA